MSSRTARACVFIALFLISISASIGVARTARGEGGEPRFFAITNARLVPVSGPVIANGTVVVAKGLIQAVGAGVAIPPEAWVIDGKGLTVYPGLIDAGTDLGVPKEEGEANASSPPGGGRGRRRVAPSGPIAKGPEDRPGTTPWRVAADELKPDDRRIETWRSAGFTTSLTIPDGEIFPGQATLINLAGERPGEMVVKPLAALPLSFKPVGGFFGFPDSLMGTIAYVRQVLDDTAWYAQAETVYEANVGRNERPPYDRAERVVARALQGKEPVLLPANNAIQILRALRLADEWKISAVLQGGQQSYAVAETIAAKRIPVLVNLKWPEPPKDADPEAETTLAELRFRDRAPSSPAALAKAGVKFTFYSNGLPGPKEIFKSVKKATDAGLSSDAALRAFTLSAAEILGVSDRLGSIEVGKIANLVVTNGDIFGEKTKVKHVFVDGRWFEVHEGPPPEKPEEKKPERSSKTVAAFPEIEAGVGR
jgi:imidazolonepropionase-like amidohydrolase